MSNPNGVIPAPGERAGVHLVGDLYDMSGRPVRVTVNGTHVVINGATLDLRRCQTLLYLLAAAVWEAGRNTAKEQRT